MSVTVGSFRNTGQEDMGMNFKGTLTFIGLYCESEPFGMPIPPFPYSKTRHQTHTLCADPVVSPRQGDLLNPKRGGGGGGWGDGHC